METLVIIGIILFVLTVVYFLWRTTQDIVDSPVKIDPIEPVELFLEDEFVVSYVYLPTDASDEIGRLKGWSFKRNSTITTTNNYKDTQIKINDIVKYRYKDNQIDNVELI